MIVVCPPPAKHITWGRRAVVGLQLPVFRSRLRFLTSLASFFAAFFAAFLACLLKSFDSFLVCLLDFVAFFASSSGTSAVTVSSVSAELPSESDGACF